MKCAFGRTVDTARFVYRTYRTLQSLKAKSLSPRAAGRLLAEDTGRMGPLYTKLAQFISARRDAIDPELADALAVVQDNVPIETVEAPPELPGYRVEPRPIASASIADVFRATHLRDKSVVAIKRRRQGVKESILTDLPLLLGVMAVLAIARVPGSLNMLELIRESRPILLTELDFRNEAAAASEFAALFRDVEWLVVPQVVAAHEDTMVSEFVPSKKIGDVMTPNPDLAQRLMDLYMMMLDVGFVHADPHPGNIGFLDGGDIVLYDFGAMLRVEGNTREKVARVLHAGIAKDAEGLLTSLESMGVLSIKSGQRTSVRRVLRRVLNGDVHEELKTSPEFFDADQRVVSFGTTFIYLTRTLTLIDGACRTLDPTFDYDYSRWIEAPAPVLDIVRNAMSMPSTMHTMQSDMEEFQARILKEIEEAKAGTTWALAFVAMLSFFFFH